MNKQTLLLDVFIEDYQREKETPVNLPITENKQCLICSRFETEDNPLFAYSYRDNGEFIYRCQKGHSHDHGMILIDLRTGLEICL